MWTTVLEADVVGMIHRVMRERHLTLDQAVNETLRAALRPKKQVQTPFRAFTFSMRAQAGADLDKTLQLAGELEDEAVLVKLRGRPAGVPATRRADGG